MRITQAHVFFWLSRLATIFLSARNFSMLQQARATTMRSAFAKSATPSASFASLFMKLYWKSYPSFSYSWHFLVSDTPGLPSGPPNLPPVHQTLPQRSHPLHRARHEGPPPPHPHPHPHPHPLLCKCTSTGGVQVGRGDVVDMEWPVFVALEFELSVSKQKARHGLFQLFHVAK